MCVHVCVCACVCACVCVCVCVCVCNSLGRSALWVGSVLEVQSAAESCQMAISPFKTNTVFCKVNQEANSMA